MRRGTKLDWLFIAVQLILVPMCIHRGITRGNPFYYILAVFWLVMAIRGIYLYFKIKKLRDMLTSQSEVAPPVDNGSVQPVKPAAVIDSFPDKPQPIGYKTGWLCIRAESSEQVISGLGLKNAVRANWESGLSEQRSGVFVSPVLYGYVLVAGYEIFGGGDGRQELDELMRIAPKFSEVQCFATHRVADVHAWAKCVNGSLVRAYGWYAGPYINEGSITPEEISLGFDKLVQTDEDDWEENDIPDEEYVMQIAAAWGIDPMFSDGRSYDYGTGYLCDMEQI